MNKKLSAAVRSVSGRDKITALGERDLVVALGAASRAEGGGDETVGTLPYTGGAIVAGPVAVPACPHVEYPASA